MHRFLPGGPRFARQRILVQSVSRESAAAPAVGWLDVHQRQEEMILVRALGLDQPAAAGTTGSEAVTGGSGS